MNQNTALRLLVATSLLTFSHSALSQTQVMSFQCTPGSSLRSGFFSFTTFGLDGVAKYKNGMISELSGLVGKPAQDPTMTPGQIAELQQLMSGLAEVRMQTFDLATNGGQNALAQGGAMMGGGMSGMNLTQGGMGMLGPMSNASPPNSFAPDNIQPTLPTADLRPGDQPSVNERPAPPPRTGAIIGNPGVVTFTARFDLNGNMSQLIYRYGNGTPVAIEIDSQHPTSSDALYGHIQSSLLKIKEGVACCAQSSAALCQSSMSMSMDVPLPMPQVATQVTKATQAQPPETPPDKALLVNPFNPGASAQ